MTTTIDLFKSAQNTCDFKAGEAIFKTGDASDGVMYVIQEGTVDILVDGVVIDTIGAGKALGELGLVDDKPRSATAVAQTACKLVSINEKRFIMLVQQMPYFALQMMRMMAERLRKYRD